MAGRAAGIVFIELLVGIIDTAARAVHRDDIVFAGYLRMPVGCLDGVEHAPDINLLQLVDQDHRRVAETGDVTGRDRQLEPLVGVHTATGNFIPNANSGTFTFSSPDGD